MLWQRAAPIEERPLFGHLTRQPGIRLWRDVRIWPASAGCKGGGGPHSPASCRTSASRQCSFIGRHTHTPTCAGARAAAACSPAQQVKVQSWPKSPRVLCTPSTPHHCISNTAHRSDHVKQVRNGPHPFLRKGGTRSSRALPHHHCS